MPIVAPSLLSANFKALADDIVAIEQAGADWHHVDVMDCHLVPNLAFSPGIQHHLNQLTSRTIDTHLMVTHPSKLIEPFAKEGSEWITFHIECEESTTSLIKTIRNLGIKVGISLKPGTPVDVLAPHLHEVDMVLVMTVEPGFGGQAFMPDMVDKINWLDGRRREQELSFLIEVDGGINDKTGASCVRAGADILVAGSYLYGSDDLSTAVLSLKELSRN